MSARRAFAAVLVAFGAVASAVSPQPARAQEKRTERPTAEAWFRLGGALPPGASTYPEGTLHVGVVAGQESDRSYLAFKVAVPDGATATAAQLVVPLDADAGTTSPETAVVQACATVAFDDGASGVPPAADCARKADGVIAEGGGDVRFDVSALIENDALRVALVPGGGTSWHLAFDSRNRAEAQPATLQITFTEPDEPVAPSVPGPSVPDGIDTSPAQPAQPAFALPPVPEPPASTGAAISAESELPTVRRTPPSFVEVDNSFKYAAVFALPLVFLIVIAVLGDGLTRPVVLEESAP